MKNMTYTDVLSMPTYERRFFIGQLTRDATKLEEQMEKAREQSQGNNGKGSRTKKISGDALKTRMKNGEIPAN
jgi:hypothetical protein